MKSHIYLAALLLLTSIPTLAQIGGGYDPDNPSDPGVPVSKYTLTLQATPTNGGRFNTTSRKISAGETYNLYAYPNTDYVFVAWICDGDTLSTSASYKFVMPEHNTTVTGVFTYAPSAPADPKEQNYLLTLTAWPTGTGSFNLNTKHVAAGSKNILYAYPNTDYAFVAWICDGDTLSTSASYEFVMPEHNTTVTGVFTYAPSAPADPKEQNYLLTLTAWPTGTGSFNLNTEHVAAGSENNLYAYPNTNYSFKQWMLGDSVISTNPELTFVMPSHSVQLVGQFEYNPANPANPGRNYWNQQTGELIIDDFTPGSLSSAAYSAINGSSNSSNVQMITVAGVLNSSDFSVANNFTNCTLLDFSRVTGVTAVPSYAFDYTNLESVYLPATIEEIGSSAFLGCSKLSAITLYAMTPPVLGSRVFTNVPEELIVYVPSGAIALYQDSEDWGKFTLLPIQEDIHSIAVSLPEEANAKDFSKMWLELTNTKSGQRLHYVVTDRLTYTFPNIIRNTSWNVTLRNERGDVFGRIDNVEVKDKDVAVTFPVLSKPQNVTLAVQTPDGKDVTAQTQITWTDASGNYVAQGTSLTGLPTGYQACYSINLSQELAMAYVTPSVVKHTLKDSGNDLSYTLESFKQVQLTGKVKDAATEQPLNGAVISASQTFGGKYTKTLNAKTDANGTFTLDVASVPTSIAVAATDYVSKTISLTDELSTSYQLPDVSLKNITGATITLGFNYTSIDGEKQNWYSDYQNINYELFNITKGQPISQCNVQYPQIVLLEEVEEGDVLRLTATSRTNAFMPVETKVTIAEQKAEAVFDIMELGRIRASFTKTGNESVVGSLYDASGKLMKTYNYSEASLTINDLVDGKYTLISMGKCRLFNTIYNLAQLPQTGLTNGSDYVQDIVEVKSGTISIINIDEVPTLDESKLYYTESNTSFTVNKPSIVAGNYLTLTGHINFKPAYATDVSNVQMIVDLPESCEFVENSVMVGNSTNSYTFNGHQITIPLTCHTDRVRFCIIPTLGGEYAPSAFVQFDLNGETITQPIGSATYTTKNLSIYVPSSVAKTTVPIRGTAIGTSTVEIYDNDVLIGQTNSLANGTWATTCELNDPYNLSAHNVYAKVTTKKGIVLITEMSKCIYDFNAILVSTVHMFYNGSDIVFDFQNPTSKPGYYSFVPSRPDFTFTIDFTKNDTTKISNVKLDVKLNDGSWKKIPATFDKKQNKWVAAEKFGNNNVIPENVAVCYNFTRELYFDRDKQTNKENEYDATIKLLRNVCDSARVMEQAIISDSIDAENTIKQMEEILAEINDLTTQEIFDDNAIQKLTDEFINLAGIEKSTVSEDVPYNNIDELFAAGYRLLTEIEQENTNNQVNSALSLSIADSILSKQFNYDLTQQDIKSLDSICFEYEGIPMLMTKKEFKDFDFSSIDTALTDTLYMSDGSSILVYITDHDFALIDETTKIVWVANSLEVSQNAPFSRLNPKRASAKDILAILKKAIDEINAVATKVSAFINLQADIIKDEIKSIEKSINYINNETLPLLESRAIKYKQILKINRQLNALNSQVGFLDLDEITRLEALKKQLVFERNKLLRDIKDINNFADKFKKSANKLKRARVLKLALLGKVMECVSLASGIYDLITYAHDGYKDYNNWSVFINSILPCPDDELRARGLMEKSKDDRLHVGIKYASAVGVSALSNIINGFGITYKNSNPLIGFAISLLTSTLSDYLNHTVRNMFQKAKNESSNRYWNRKQDKNLLNCNDDDDDDDNQNREEYEGDNAEHVIDPSGYVYEGVTTNRLEGVTATAYYKEMVEDMYGDLHENVVKWDAEEYAQENPLFTDENGMYAWDVPQGLWQVKFEKEGYETIYSDWLPVPPPQLDVNIAMRQNRQPVVKNARAYEDAVEMEFDKYMMPELLTTDNITVVQDSKPIDGHIELLNSEVAAESSGKMYVSKIRFNATQPFTEHEITLMVNKRVKSYAGIRMQDNYQQTFTIEQEIKQILSEERKRVGYGKTTTLSVAVVPASASRGKTLTIETSSSMIVAVEKQHVILNNEGKAEIVVSGELPGAAALTFTVEGTDKTATTIVSVEQIIYQTVATPTANIASGTTVKKGTEIKLSCATENATIYYTLDGTCPCNETNARMVYNYPIVISESVTIKAIAVATDMYESDIAEFCYIVANDAIEIPYIVNSNGIGTLILPFESDVPTGMFAYAATDVVADLVQLDQRYSIEAGIPLLIMAVPGDYMFAGIPTVNTDITYTEGLLTGTLENRNVAKGYVLQEQDGLVAFYRIDSERPVPVPAYHCWLNLPSDIAFIRIGDTTTGIDKITKQDTVKGIYDLSGRKRKEASGSGVYIVNGRKIIK